MKQPISPKVIYPELSYRIVGIAFKIFNDIGYGMPEKYYQKAFAKILEQEGISFEKEKRVPLQYGDHSLGYYQLDFVIENKLIVELKVRPNLGYVHIKQAMGYLQSTGHKLALLIYFTRDGVKYRRILNAS